MGSLNMIEKANIAFYEFESAAHFLSKARQVEEEIAGILNEFSLCDLPEIDFD